MGKLESLQQRQGAVAREIEELVQGIEMYINRTLYTAGKKKELETSKDKIIELRNLEEEMRFALGMFSRVEDSLNKSQFQTAVLLFKYLEDKKVTAKIDVPEFTEIYNALRQGLVTRLEKGVEGMLNSWLGYCSSREKEIGDRAMQQIETMIKILYSNTVKSKDRKSRLTNNIRMSYAQGNIIQRESLAYGRKSLVDGPMGGRQSTYLRNTVARNIDPNNREEFSSQFLPNTKIDMHILKSCLSVQETLKTKKQFLEKVKDLRRSYLMKHLNLLTKNLTDIKSVLCSTLAFFIAQAQLDELAPEIKFLDDLMKVFQEKLTEYFLETCKFGYSKEEVLILKKYLHFCAFCARKKNLFLLEAVYLDSNYKSNLVCETLLPLYHLKVVVELSSAIEDWKLANKFRQVEIMNLEDYGRSGC